MQGTQMKTAKPLIRTFTGKRVHPYSLHPDEIDVDDIAHSLSQQCRFLGHTDAFYSVAQHSVLVSQIVPPEDALWGLLHDATEAYLCNVPAPIKCAPEMWHYRMAEGQLVTSVAARFGLPPTIPDSVKLADLVLLATEFRDVTTVIDLDWIVAECGIAPLPDMHILPWPCQAAEERFLHRFWELTR